MTANADSGKANQEKETGRASESTETDLISNPLSKREKERLANLFIQNKGERRYYN